LQPSKWEFDRQALGNIGDNKNNDGMERYRGLDMKWEATETGVEMGLTQQSFGSFQSTDKQEALKIWEPWKITIFNR
jgi:hypothetical protein